MKKFVFLILTIVVIFLIYRGAGRGIKDQTLKPVNIALVEQNDSGEMGQAVLAEVDGQVRVMLDLTGISTGVLQPAHIHRGTCAALGEIIYTLNQVEDGKSETTITASLGALQTNLPLAINVHKSLAEAGISVACGELAS